MAFAVKLLEPVTDDALLRISGLNRNLRFERTASGEILVSPPTGGTTGARNAALLGQLFLWNETHGRGVVFDSSTGFRLPDTSVLSPDASWIDRISWEALAPKMRAGYPPICPNVAFELVSQSDTPYAVRLKIQSYIENGCGLAVSIDPQTRTVETYAPGEPPSTLRDPQTLVLQRRFFPGAAADLKLDLAKIIGPTVAE